MIVEDFKLKENVKSSKSYEVIQYQLTNSTYWYGCRNHFLVEFNNKRKSIKDSFLDITINYRGIFGYNCKYLPNYEQDIIYLLKTIHEIEEDLKITKTIPFKTKHKHTFVFRIDKKWFIAPQMFSLYLAIIKGEYKEIVDKAVNYFKKNGIPFVDNMDKNYSWGNHWLKYLHYPQNKKWWTNNRLREYKYAYKLTLDKFKLIKLKTLNDFIKFTSIYGIKTNKIRPSKYTEYLLSRNFYKPKFYKSFKYSYVINWRLVKQNYSGIDIRFNNKASDLFYWYEAWDCSCGCIWNKNAIKKLKLI